jgi:hypothetical protein
MVKGKKKILFFMAGANPTPDELAAAEKIGTTCFRNASVVFPNEALEECDAVAGAAPAEYVKKFGMVKEKAASNETTQTSGPWVKPPAEK